MDIVGLLISILIDIVVVAPILWLVGRGLVGKAKAKFTDAIWIVALGVVIGTVVNYGITFLGGILAGLGGIIAAIIMLIVWLALIKHFFDCGWLMAFAIAIIAVIVYVVVMFILGIIIVLLGLGAILSGLGGIGGFTI